MPLFSGTQTWRVLENWFTRGDLARSTSSALPWPTTRLLNRLLHLHFCRVSLLLSILVWAFSLMIGLHSRLLANTALSASKISSMRSWLLGLTSRRLTTSSGHSNYRHPWVDLRERGTTMSKVEMLGTVKTTSMNSLEGWTRIFCKLWSFRNFGGYVLLCSVLFWLFSWHLFQKLASYNLFVTNFAFLACITTMFLNKIKLEF